MQLVAEGLLDLDLPVRSYLPSSEQPTKLSSKKITVRQLLSHTAGFEGDVFVDTGRGDDALAKFVQILHGASQVSQPGELFSYNNAGFSVIGRVIEVLRGEPFDAVLRKVSSQTARPGQWHVQLKRRSCSGRRLATSSHSGRRNFNRRRCGLATPVPQPARH